MKRLKGYIKVINENASDKGTMYENLIYKALIFLQEKENIDIEKQILNFENTTNNNLLKDLNLFLKNYDKSLQDFVSIEDAKIKLKQIKIEIIKKFLNDKVKNLNDEFKEKFIVAYLSEDKLSEESKALKIAKLIINEIKKPIDAVKVTHIGNKKGNVSQYWLNISKQVSYYLNEVNKENEYNKKFFSKTKNEKLSISKTDIIYDNYNLSLKMKEKGSSMQLATPSIIDIYTLIFHGIKKFIDNNPSKLIANFKNDEMSIKTDTASLINFIDIKNIKTTDYVTIIYVSLLIDLILIENKSINTFSNIALKNILNSSLSTKEKFLKIYKLIELNAKEENEQISKFLDKKISDKYIELIDKNKKLNKKEKYTQEISDLTTLSEKMLNQLNEQVKEYKLIKDYVKEMNDFFIKNDDDIYEKIKQNKLIDNDETKENIKKIILVLKGLDNKFNKISNIKEIEQKIINFSNNQEKKILEYKKVSTSKKDQKKANLIFNDKYFQNNIETNSDEKLNIEKLFNNKDNLNQIKKEILKEAITGTYKFQDNKENIATHILEFDIEENPKIKLISLTDNSYIEEILKKINFNFSFKGGSKNSFVALRFQISDSFNNKNNNDLQIYNELFFDKIKDFVYNKIDNLKAKFIKIIMSKKNSIIKLLNFLNFKIKIKKSQMPNWIVNKL